jgi:DNA-binding PucR family transcriptional regulator/ligand-binding sensor protein/GAF domain-containing protein
MTDIDSSDTMNEAATGGELAETSLAALIGVPTLQAIQDTFAQVFGLPTSIVNADGSPVTAITNRVPFCEDLTKGSDLGCSRCDECDRNAFAEAKSSSAPAVFKCWNGLYDAAIPIAPKGKTIGYFLCGQIYSETPDLISVGESAVELGIDPELYTEQASQIQVMPYERYEASIQTMHVLAGMIAEQAAAYIDNLEILEQSVAAREDTRRLIDELDGILAALKDIGLQPDHRATLHAIADNLASLIPHDSCVIYGLDGEHLQPLIVRDPQPEPLWKYRPTIGEGIVGNVAATRTARRCDEVRDEPDFISIDGLESEPEAILVAPIVDKGELFGVVVLSRLERRLFTDHELSILSVFASQASVAIERSQIQAESAKRLAEERALADLLRAMTGQLTLEETLTEISRDAMALLSATGAVVRVAAPGAAASVSQGIADDQAAEIFDQLEPAITAAVSKDEAEVATLNGLSCLIVPLQSGPQQLGVILLTRSETERPWDVALVEALASQASLGIANRLMHDRERDAAQRYRGLAELTSDLVAADSEDQLIELLVTRLSSVISAENCFVALRGRETEAISVLQRVGRQVKRTVIPLAGSSRIASARLGSEADSTRASFDTWAEGIWKEIDGQLSLRTWLAEPLVTASGIIGGTFVAWPEQITEVADGDGDTLRVVAGSASARLTAIENQAETDDELRSRIDELQALTQLAQRLTGLDDRTAIIDELLLTFRELGRLDGAAYCHAGRSGSPTVGRELDLPGATAATIEAELALITDHSAPLLSSLGNGRQLVVLPLTGHPDALLAGVGEQVRNPDRDPVLGALARYGSVALERVRLQERQRRAISRLERENRDASADYGRLERILDLNRELTHALLNASGSAAVATTIGEVLSADVSIIDADGVTLASSTEDAAPTWTPELDPFLAESVVSEHQGGTTIAAPVLVDDAIAAWVVAHFQTSAGAIEQAAIEHAAVLTALDHLRERTIQDVATRLRHGFLDELFSGEFVDELAIQRGQALGLDLRRAARTYLIEVIGGDHSPGQQRAVVDVVSEIARAHSEHIIAQVDETIVAIIAEESLDPEAKPAEDDPIELRLQSAIAARKLKVDVNIAAGTACERPGDYRESHSAARRGLDFLRLVDSTNEMISFRRPGVEQLLLSTGEPAALLAFVARYIEPLDRYDEDHSTELRHTLEVFYAQQGRLEPSARELHVHVSTLRYRLERIEKLVGVDPRAGESRLDLEVALRAAQVLPIHRDSR